MRIPCDQDTDGQMARGLIRTMKGGRTIPVFLFALTIACLAVLARITTEQHTTTGEYLNAQAGVAYVGDEACHFAVVGSFSPCAFASTVWWQLGRVLRNRLLGAGSTRSGDTVDEQLPRWLGYVPDGGLSGDTQDLDLAAPSRCYLNSERFS